MNLLICVPLYLLGTVSGIYATGLIHDHRIRDLSATQYTAMHQMRDKTFRSVMPFVGLGTLASLVVATLFGLPAGVPTLLGALTVVMLMVDIALTIRLQLPLNKRIQSWTPETIPCDWAQVRDRWARQHNLRVAISMTAFAVFCVAVQLGAAAH